MTVEELEDLLGRLEALEDPLLSWGVVEGALSAEDVDDAIDGWLLEMGSGHDPLDVLDALLDAGLLVRAEGHGGGYRTRVAEHLRLVSNLRQLFPARDGSPRPWSGAPTLVGGLRYTRQPRQYPRRDMDPVRVMEQVTEPGTVEREAFRKLVTAPDGHSFTLSAFQQRATRSILDSVASGRTAGVIIGAGTGSGKTLAFYLPALVHISGQVGPRHGLRALALYPRNELLRDQLQTGVEEALKLRKLVHEAAGRPLRVGALFGAVPQTVAALGGRFYASWRKQGETFVCPYLVCPSRPPGSEERCGGDLVVRSEDASLDEPALRCVECDEVVDPAVFPVTRDQLRRRPPDVLFCSTEMLNRGLLDPTSHELLGVGVRPGPELVLLDEVHTYGGTTGAMTALTLRRWRHRVQSRPTFVGLSATLVDAPRFFGDLVGLPTDLVSYVTPDPDELTPEGAEYHVAVRSDPTSGVSVLSTTIQTAMLLGRTMDAADDDRSLGLFGRKVYAFTDDLDVTNRLYFDLLDAEGQRHRGRGPNRPYKESLARLRSPELPEVDGRRHAGQVWDLAHATGRGIGVSDRLQVGRTSSQDGGVDETADVVVATASLEVGVDDPAVGAVLQHKAPRDPAAFLQRRGRAGRERGMRPMTTVVLSDYGRDRHAYEAWDQLLSPVLRPSALPVHNVHVLRMQAALATLEWAVERAGPEVRGRNMWSLLAGPSRHDRDRAAQDAVAEQLEKLLRERTAQDQLGDYLMRALRVDRSTARDLLWQPPRPVLLGAVPALLRRIADGWRLASPQEEGQDGRRERGLPTYEDEGMRQPLPTFVPATLFSPLALPEVVVEMPAWSLGADGVVGTETLGLVQALRELAPGRVTKRFAVRSDLDRAWVPADPAQRELDVRSFVSVAQTDGQVCGVPLLRPLRVRTQQPSEDVRDSSHGRPVWVSEVARRGPGVDLGSVTTDPLGRRLNRMRAHLHRDQDQVEVRRGVVASEVRVSRSDGTHAEDEVRLIDGGEPVAIGGVFDVDALRFHVEIEVPPTVWDGPGAPALRAAWFEWSLTRSLAGVVDRFLTGWVHDVVLAALLRVAVLEDVGLQAAWERIRTDLPAGVTPALRLLLAAPGADEADLEVADGKLAERLREAMADAEVLQVLVEVVPALWSPPDATADEWLRTRWLRTVGEALLAGAATMCPEHDPSVAVLDVEPPGAEPGEIWLSETTIGGGGFLEAVADAVSANPARFIRFSRAALRPGGPETVGVALERVLEAAVDGTHVSDVFEWYRRARTAAERSEQVVRLRDRLRDLGLPATPEVVGSVATRLLRPGSSPETDQAAARSLSRWDEAQRRLGVEIPLRTWTFLDATQADSTDEGLLERLQLMLWPRGSRERDRGFATYNPFADMPDPRPALLEDMLRSDSAAPIEVARSEEAWPKVVDELQRSGFARFCVPPAASREGVRLAARLATTQVELESLLVRPALTGLDRDLDGRLTFDVELPQLGRWLQRAEASGELHTGPAIRRVMTGGDGPTSEVQSILDLFFGLEVLEPSAPLWIVSAWLSDVPVLDNRGGALLSVAPGLPTRRVGVVDVLSSLIHRGGDVRVVVRDEPHNRTIVGRLRELEQRTTPGSITVEVRENLHDKLLVSEHLLIEGSMNLTHRGALANEEGVRVIGESEDIARQRAELERKFGGPR